MKRGTGSFGPVVAIAEGMNPKFKDVISSAFWDLDRNEYYEAYRDCGFFCTGRSPDGDRNNIETSGRQSIEGKYLMGLLLVQSIFGKASEIAKNAWKYPYNDFGVQARHFG